MKKLTFTLLSISSLLLSGCNSSKGNMYNEAVKRYMNAKDEATIIETLELGTGLWPFSECDVSFKENWNYPYTVEISTNKDYSNSIKVLSYFGDLSDVIPALSDTTHYIRVFDSNNDKISEVVYKTNNCPGAFINIKYAQNIRDIGGWKAEGKRVNYKKIYRGPRLNRYANAFAYGEEGKEIFDTYLGINTEIDLRHSGDNDSQDENVINPSKNYVMTPINAYDCLLEYAGQTRPFTEACRTSIKRIFEVLANEDNYPIYIHCNAGADRTGSISFILNGLLGVSYEDLTKDFELTSFTQYGKRYRSKVVGDHFDDSGVMQDDNQNYVAWDKFYVEMMRIHSKDGTLKDAIYNYLTNFIGVEENQIEAFRKIMLE